MPPASRTSKKVIDNVNDTVNYIDMEEHEWSKQVTGMDHKGGEPHLFFEIMRTYHAFASVFSRKMGIPFSRLRVLRVLAVAFPRKMGILEIARRMNINGAAITRQIKEMEGLGLVARTADSRDGRRWEVGLTAEGHELFQQIHRKQHEFEEMFASGEVTPEEVKTAARVLFRLRSVLEKVE
jgi:DNA-binding MarR family transcriptional regulator